MNHRTYDAQRYSPLDKHQQGQRQEPQARLCRRASAAPSANENLQATPLAEDGFLYVVDQWGVLYKIDARSGDMGRIVWRMDPEQEKLPLSNRGAALWGNLVISSRQLSAAHHRHRQGHRQGRLGNEPVRRPAGLAAHRRAARGQGQDHRRRRRRRPRRARLHRGARRRDRQAALAQIRRSRRPASPAAKPGRTRTRSPGRPAAAPCG